MKREGRWSFGLISLWPWGEACKMLSGEKNKKRLGGQLKCGYSVAQNQNIKSKMVSVWLNVDMRVQIIQETWPDSTHGRFSHGRTWATLGCEGCEEATGRSSDHICEVTGPSPVLRVEWKLHVHPDISACQITRWKLTHLYLCSLNNICAHEISQAPSLRMGSHTGTCTCELMEGFAQKKGIYILVHSCPVLLSSFTHSFFPELLSSFLTCPFLFYFESLCF